LCFCINNLFLIFTSRISSAAKSTVKTEIKTVKIIKSAAESITLTNPLKILFVF